VLEEVERVCDRVAILQRGRLVHVQDMRSLRAERRIRARLAHPGSPITALPGLRTQMQSDGAIDMLYDGPMPELLSWLAGQAVVDLQIEPAGLAEVYHRYHPNG
jgi:ABC-2 type transport system ATP-binding protein